MNELFFVAVYLLSFPSPSHARDRILPAIYVVACVCFPVCASKQIISAVQMWRAAQSLVEGDVEARRQEAKGLANGGKKE